MLSTAPLTSMRALHSARRAGIKALMQGKGDGYVVTEEDMRAIANQAMQAARERMAGALP